MDTITVDKETLLNALRENRDEHQEIFDKAQVVYREKMIEELDRALQEAREGGKIRRGFSLPVPENHVDDFNTAILMLEWDQGETVEISLREFKMYVENEWGWQRSFAENTGSYSMQYQDDD